MRRIDAEFKVPCYVAILLMFTSDGVQLLASERSMRFATPSACVEMPSGPSDVASRSAASQAGRFCFFRLPDISVPADGTSVYTAPLSVAGWSWVSVMARSNPSSVLQGEIQFGVDDIFVPRLGFSLSPTQGQIATQLVVAPEMRLRVYGPSDQGAVAELWVYLSGATAF